MQVNNRITFTTPHFFTVTVGTIDEGIYISCEHPDQPKTQAAFSHETFAAILAIYTQYKAGATQDEVCKWMQDHPSYRINIEIEDKTETYDKS